jgi:tripartite-type tricarboxylate transporter receptor subunit TctC
MSKLRILKLSFAALVTLALIAPAKSQGWPQRPVKIVVPYAAGGGSDTIARMIADRFSKVFGQQFYVENKAGANGTIAADEVAHSRPDGYTLFMAVTSQIAIAPAMMNVRYDPMKDFVPITAIITNNFALVVNGKVSAKTASEFVKYVRAQPAPLPYSSGGIGSVTNLVMELFLKRAGLKMTNVAYKGASPAMTAVIAGQVPAMFAVLSDALPHATNGSIRLLAVSSENRALQAPDVPTLIESGFPGFTANSWNGLMAPAGTPKEIVDRIAVEVANATEDAAFLERLKNFGADPVADSSPEHFSKMIAADIALWSEAASIAGIKRQ